MKMRELSDLHRKLIELSKGKTGYGTDEIPGHDVKEVGHATAKLKRLGLLFSGKRGHRTVRYFSRADDAEIWERAGMKAATVKVGPLRAPWSIDQEPVFTERTKYTYGRSPQGQVLRSNTHGQW